MLWNTKTCKTWQDSLEQYEGLLLAHKINELDKIDVWYRDRLHRSSPDAPRRT